MRLSIQFGNCLYESSHFLYGMKVADCEWLNRYRNIFIDIGCTFKREKVDARSKYWKKRKLRFQIRNFGLSLGSDDETQHTA